MILRAILICAVAVAASACISTGAYSTLPQADQERFHRCWSAMQPATCGSDTDGMYVANCRNGAMASYAERGTDDGRRQYLMENGCPASMVHPERQ